MSLAAGSLYVNNAVSGMDSGSLLAAYQYVGSTGSGTFDHSGGSNTTTSFFLGDSLSGKGVYNLGGVGRLGASSEYVGNSGSGTLTQSGGTNSCSILRLAYRPGSNGIYNLNGTGCLNAATEYVGYAGSGTFNHSGGTNNVSSSSSSSSLYIGYSTGSVGTYNLSDAVRQP